MAESNRCIVQVFVGAVSQHYESLSVEASKQTTCEDIVSCIVERLQLTNTVEYELAEVVGEECKERRLGPQECPVALMLLWPQSSFDNHNAPLSSEPSTDEDQHRFCLREKLNDAHWTDSFTMDPQLIRDYFCLFLYQPKDRDYPDLCQLPDLNEQTLLENLRARFSNGHIYTYVGSILIAVNPFKFYPIYNPKYVKLYQNRRLGDMPPHIFAIADAAYHSMLREKCNQCIVISGESGSGKTESTNFLLHHLTALSQKGSHGSGVEQTILSAGPVLEAFGNAKTAHNNNSSRFGKFIQVNYKENGMVHGAVVQKYLLEKSRICSHGRMERNYHVFYYLLAGASDVEKRALHLRKAEEYNYLSKCASNELDNIDESYEFSRLKQSMEMVGFSAEKQRRLFAVLSAVLLLGNVEFAPRKSAYHHDEAVGVKNPEIVALISQLLRVKEETLMAALTAKRARASGETLVINYRLPEAIAARDAMAKCLYGALFDWIVLQVNHALLSKKDTLRDHQGNSIGVLDIFGFEDFGVFNSFEQFCINYANEHLQYYFNQHVFKYEQEEYRKEGIKWTSIAFMDNTGCLQLIEGKPNGLLCILDDQCNFPGATNETLLQKFNSVHKENSFYEVPQKREAAFIVKHYAGKVKYQVLEVREKNLDLMRQDIVSVLKNSSMAFVRELVGADPVAVFRWAIVRAFFRAYFAFNEAGTRHRLVRVDGSKASLIHHRYRSHTPNESIISVTRASGPIFTSNQKFNEDYHRHSSYTPNRRSSYSQKENERRDSNARKKGFGSSPGGGGGGAVKEDQELNPTGRKESVSSLSRVLCPSEAKVLERANQIVMKNKSFRPRERGKKGLKNLETVKTLAGRTQSYGNNQMKGVGTRKQPLTVTAQFQQSLHSLMITLNQANPFFIRCIKSNGNKVSNEFDADTVQRQLRYTGMLETVRIRQAGYNVRLTYDEFIQLYRILLPKGLVSSQADVRNFLLTLNLNRDNYQMGHTKVFLRESEKVKLDYRLHQQIIASIVAIQRWFRASLERKRFLLLRRVIIGIQSHCRAYLVRQKVNQLRLVNSAARYIQCVWRGHKTRCWYLKLLAGVRVLQAHARGMLARRKFQALLLQHHLDQAQQHTVVTKVANRSIIHLNADDSYVLRNSTSFDAQRKSDEQKYLDISRKLQNLSPLESEIPKRRLYVAKTRTVEGQKQHGSFEEAGQDLQQGASNQVVWRKGSSESLTSLKSTDSITAATKPTLQDRAKKQIQAFIVGCKVDKWGNNALPHSDSETEDVTGKHQKDWKKSSLDSAPQPNRPLLRSPHVMLHRFSSGDTKNQRSSGDLQWPEQQEQVVVRPNRHHRVSREMSYSVGDNEVDSQPAIRWSRSSAESPEFRSRTDTRGSEGSSECSLMSPRDSDVPKFLKMGAAAHPTSSYANAPSSQKRQWSPQSRGELDQKRRNSDPAKSDNITHTHPDPRHAPERPKPHQEIEYKGTMFTIAGHRFRKVSRFNKEDKCVSCGKCMDAFITQGHKCTECKQLFHTKCIQNGGVQKMPCQNASGGGKPGRRKHRKHSRTPYDMSKPQGAGKFSLTGTSEFTDSTDKIISDARELQLMQDFITNKIYKIESEEGKKPSEVDRVFKQALKEFKDNLLSTYSIVNKQGADAINIKYKDLIANFLQVMETVCYQENTREDFPVTMGVNAFRGFMNEFMAQNRLEEKPKTKRKKEKKRKTEDPISHFGHLFQLTIINIPTACEKCNSFFMWPIERGLVCQNCKLTCHRKCYIKVKMQCGKDDGSKCGEAGDMSCKTGRVFGVPLARLAVGDGKVPIVVDRLITTIEMYGLYTEGLYRKSGVSSKVRELKVRIEEDFDQVNLENYQIHVLASLLKSFFRDMPEPLLTFECYDDFLRAGSLTEPQDRITTLFAILKKLPKPNFVLMERLIFHLARVALHEDANRMNASALAIVFAPCILRTNKRVPAQDSLSDISRQTQCVETIISEQLRKVRSTLADIETLDTACHTATHRLSSLRSSKVFQPEEFPQSQQNPSSPSSSVAVSASVGTGQGTEPSVEGEEEALLEHHIHAMQKEKSKLMDTLPTLSHATSDDDLLSTDLDGSLDDVASATCTQLDESLPVPACSVVPTARSGRIVKRTSSSSDHSVVSMCPPLDVEGEEDPIMVTGPVSMDT